MTDYTKLIEQLRSGKVSYYEGRSADAIEALQAECASLKQIVDLNAQIAIDLKAERDQLQSQLDAMGKGEPVSVNVEILLEAAEVLDKVRSQCDDAWERFGLRDYLPDELHGTALIVRDAAPKALAPRFIECRIELVVAIHTLASHYENRLGQLDPEDRKLAEGDIAHAMATAAKWNWNGNGIGGTP